MGKLNVSIDDRLRDELFGLVPPSQRSQVVNEALRKELLRRKRQQATEVVRRLRRRSATLSRREIVEAVQRDRAGPCPNVGVDLRAATGSTTFRPVAVQRPAPTLKHWGASRYHIKKGVPEGWVEAAPTPEKSLASGQVALQLFGPQAMGKRGVMRNSSRADHLG